MNDEPQIELQNTSTSEPSSGTSARGALGCFLGAIGGPCLFFLALYILSLIFPNEEEVSVSPFMIFAAFILSIPGGAVVGTLIAVKAPAVIKFIKRRPNS